MKRRRTFCVNSPLAILAIAIIISNVAFLFQCGIYFVGATPHKENIILLSDLDDLSLHQGRIFLGGVNGSSLAALALIGLLGALALAGLAGLAYLLYQREEGGDNHYYYSSGYDKHGFDHIGHADHGGSGYGDYDEFYRRRKRRNAQANKLVASKLLVVQIKRFCNSSF